MALATRAGDSLAIRSISTLSALSVFVSLAVLVLLAGACATKRPAASPAAAPGTPASSTAFEPRADGLDDAPPDEGTGEPGTNESPDPAADDDAADDGPCPADMALVETASPAPRRYCVDRYEASLVEVLAGGSEQPFPHYLPVDGRDVRAVSAPGSFPQGFISEVQAQDACSASGKRLCTMDEWKTACMGPARTTFPYGDARRPGVCHDTGKSAVLAVFGAKAVAASTPALPARRAAVTAPQARAASSARAPAATAATAAGKRAHVTKGRAAQSSRPRVAAKATNARPTNARPTKSTKPTKAAAPKKGARRATGKRSARPASVDPGVWARLNEPALGQVEGALSRTGEHAECVNDFGVFDMVGNIHEWVATDPAAVHGTFAGGYYLDTTLNGDGCNYRTVAHAHDYHDYSTGFRCCSAAAPARP